MSKPKATPVNLPYASTVASYSRDQGGAIGNSFLGSLFKNGAIKGLGKPSMMGPNSGSGMLK